MTTRNRHRADMTEFTQSENALIDKLENIAGITNENVLSDTEISQGHVLLAKARENLYDHSSSPSQLSLADHISRLSIALAPHKSLPPEILERIFCFILHNLSSVYVPVNLTQYQWVLGRVCSSWRRISRSIPNLWYTFITLGRKVDKKDPNYDVALLRDLRYATEILPEVAYLALSVYEGTRVPIGGLAPYLHRLDKLYWSVSSSPEQAALEAFPLESLSRLKNLEIRMDSVDTQVISHTMSYPALFGESARLQYLDFASNNPNFLISSNIPWSQLLYLHISHLYPDEHPSWLLLGRRDPFRQLTCLKELVLDLNTAILRVVLHYGFPWHRLEKLSLHCPWSYEAEDIIPVIETLRKCSSLTYLYLDSPAKSSNLINYPQKLIALPSLEELRLEMYAPLCVIDSIVSCSFRFLELGETTLEDFYAIIRRCPRLTELYCGLTDDAEVSFRADPIVLPHLTKFSSSPWDASLSFPTLLIAPRLTSLKLCPERGSLPIDLIVAFLLQSNMQLYEFVCKFKDDTVRYPSADSLRKLLTLLNSCSHVYIRPVNFPEAILDEIGSGSLFPRARSLTFDAFSPKLIVATIRRRLEQERESCRVRLSAITVRTLQKLSNVSHIEADVKDLEEEFGVNFKVSYK
ncbi:hypothetical protein C0995_004717 [Termitomyces sp. Mi166|nr:hypothetical protein C0995_004717 [Termitomyces sp. Mi166\